MPTLSETEPLERSSLAATSFATTLSASDRALMTTAIDFLTQFGESGDEESDHKQVVQSWYDTGGSQEVQSQLNERRRALPMATVRRALSQCIDFNARTLDMSLLRSTAEKLGVTVSPGMAVLLRNRQASARAAVFLDGPDDVPHDSSERPPIIDVTDDDEGVGESDVILRAEGTQASDQNSKLELPLNIGTKEGAA